MSNLRDKMRNLKRELIACYGGLETGFSFLRHHLGWEVVFFTYSVANALCIALIGIGQGAERVLYLVIGALVWGFLSVLFHEISMSITYERWEGTIEYTFMAPIRRLTGLGSTCIFAGIYGMIRSAVILVCVSFFLGLSLKGANLLGVALVLLASALPFMGLGLAVSVLPLMSPEKGQFAGRIVEAVLLLVSGIYYEIEVLPVWLQPLSRISPATYTLRAIRAALLGGATLGELFPTILLLLAAGAVLIPLGLFIFHRAEIYAKKTGKLKRSG